MRVTRDHCWLGHACDAESALVTPAERAPTPPATGPYRELRRGLVQWMASKANRFGLKTLTIHYAANYLDRCLPRPLRASPGARAARALAREPCAPCDAALWGCTRILNGARRPSHCRVMPHIRLAPGKYHALAAACLLIAAKFEERPDNVPYISEIVNDMNDAYDLAASDVSQLELLVVKTLDWRLFCTTYLHFLDFHKCQGVLDETDKIYDMAVTDKMRTKLLKYINFFADMLVLDADFCGFPKTIASAAIIATARWTVGVEPVWPAALAEKTGFSAEEIAPCVQQIVVSFCRDWPDAAPQHLRNADQSPKAVRITVSHPPPERAVGVNENTEFADENANHNVMCLESPRKVDVTWEGDSLCSNAPTEEAVDGHNNDVSVGDCNHGEIMLED